MYFYIDTLVAADTGSAAILKSGASTLQSELGTMVINQDSDQEEDANEEQDDGTMKREALLCTP